eukprot:3247888-Heterocapsa_arctica.AAC.1
MAAAKATPPSILLVVPASECTIFSWTYDALVGRGLSFGTLSSFGPLHQGVPVDPARGRLAGALLVGVPAL